MVQYREVISGVLTYVIGIFLKSSKTDKLIFVNGHSSSSKFKPSNRNKCNRNVLEKIIPMLN